MSRSPFARGREAGVSLIEMMIAVAIMGALSAGFSTMVTNSMKAAQSLEQRLDISGAKAALISRINCAQTLRTTGYTCTNGADVDLRDWRGALIVGPLATTGDFAGAGKFAGNIWVKAKCDKAHETLEIRLAEEGAPGKFAADRLNPSKLYNFAAVPHNPAFGAPNAATLAVPVCSELLGHPPPEKVPPGVVIPRDCGPDQFSAGIDTTYNVICRDRGRNTCAPGMIVQSIDDKGMALCVPKGPGVVCKASQMQTGIDAHGNPVCSPRGPAQADCGAGLVMTGLKANGDVNCESKGSAYSCPKGQIADGILADGKAHCIDRGIGNCPTGQIQFGILASGKPNCKQLAASCGPGQVLAGFSSSGTPTCVDKLVAKTCPAGEKLSAIAGDGSATCTPDDNGSGGGFTWVSRYYGDGTATDYRRCWYRNDRTGDCTCAGTAQTRNIIFNYSSDGCLDYHSLQGFSRQGAHPGDICAIEVVSCSN